MSSAFKTLKSNLILQSIALVITGAVLLLVPDVTMMTLVYVLAFLLTIVGAWALISYFKDHMNTENVDPDATGTLVFGIALLILPIVMFILPNVFVTFISMLAGILLFLSGILNIVRSVKLRKTSDRSWAASLVISIIITAAGVLLVFDPFESATMFVRILGVCLVANGLGDLLLIFWSRSLEGSL